ncbi:hypothetical protein HBI56_180820 [Parastagonospora nodorum]|uniref:Leucine-rich repeat domain-containing protein n=2 Tax=Phaeosphaeria nodorum (strain SN15 / ATCC MYA-4574 / FGSC 10173) TaxID=321614 RepID=A0A7U2I2L9_PHANO|nr:hypothetical protein HBH56_186200 [Parastagonospora nodorum]QRD01041.1 hypothetical protein JI435_153580 [Parastagonospora nodorum SN15]KAH3925360.1 hypothetical protein HBH54_182360 [Parastagonospora nodorum]KAH3940671.1 hypothetical protein HBH53_213890 [Parastagonospora nodorum]KAH3958258.1 hypothetical protein HBH51_212510 [Parastagonospora nodorum]
MSKSAVTLEDLPDELVLEIVQGLGCIRSYETQSTAFKNRAKEIGRQCENRARQLALHSLCLTNHRLRGIATPILYASFCGSLTWYGSKPLQLFYRTVRGSNTGSDRRVRYLEYLQYIENRLADNLGNSLHRDSSHADTTDMAANYLQLLADIAVCAPNLQRLCVVSLETSSISFWQYVIPGGGYPPFEDKAITSVFQKLESASLQIHAESASVYTAKEVAWFHSICSSMVSVPKLKDFRASGVTSQNWTPKIHGAFKQLQRLEFTECCLDIEDVVDIWNACQGLRHIVCEWAFLIATGTKPSDLYTALLRHSKTLQTLHLDMREVRTDDGFTASERLGSLQLFTALKSLAICEITLLGHVWTLAALREDLLPRCLTDLLPTNLESFALLLLEDQAMENIHRLQEPLVLSTFVRNCQRGFSGLKEVRVVSIHDIHAPKITNAFEGTGVNFSLVTESKHSFFGM